ncbi:DNA topoisomerase IV, A subunit [Hyphomonas neptunium ATCC 15444]|uniref:DNA topoisomerase 4 subunit A n=2 Tax=Hyphomonas TaxID=85 RepID=Q0C3T5_HYPNA|nr:MULTISPECIES: DNA topoisomerase IV subunit A [Hyphomonas]ABI76020.1 DNA topoisomerase IV, A subunit [Hyphomonas neptunium ATCC 15444]KCZ96181.1 DNA topoisomerase IV subunit A [Hyphomonas hirschiana VP5]
MSKSTAEPPADRIINEPMSEALSKRYLAYALSTITSRALPDVRDGLKPVQRRILYGMRVLRLDPEGGYRKCAKIVGDVMGNYHPHGDSSIYDTLVRLAQDFNVRYPLVDGQGNFGNIDGDSAAAYRYTEARMTRGAELLMEGLDENAVDFRPNYAENDEEPVVLPAGFPNLLANGATGIAVGMATSIPPHNVAEIIDAARHLIEKPKATTEELMEFVQGPDFPTGGVIVEDRASMLEAYETGRGAFRMRARWHVEDTGRGTYQIIVTEIPYQVQKSRLLEKLSELLEAKKVPLLEDVRDESAEDVRLVLVPRAKTVEPDVLMESLFRTCDLETRFSLNMNVLHKGAPQVMGLRDVLQAYLDHRREVVVRRAEFRLDKIEKRLHILEGFLKAYLNIDEVIRIIRTEDEPKPVLMKRFKISDIQAEAILNLRLRALRKLEEMEIQGEHTKLTEERDELVLLIGSVRRQWTRVSKELKAARDEFDPSTALGRRRATFEQAPTVDLAAALEATRPKEPVTVVLSAQGWIRGMKGHGLDPDTIKFKEGDGPSFTEEVMSTDKLVFMSSDGRAFMLPADKLPGGRGHGEPIRISIELEDNVAIVGMFKFEPERKRVMASSTGYGFVVPEAELESNRKAGKQIVNTGGGHLNVCVPVLGDMIAVVGTNRKMLIFPLKDLPEMPRGKGNKLQSYSGGAELADLITFDKRDGLIVVTGGRFRAFEEWKEWKGQRAQAGKVVPKGFPRTGTFSG